MWEGAPRLIALYNFFLAELLGSNLTKDRKRAAAVAELIGRIGDAWRQAADAVGVVDDGAGKVRVGGVA